MMPAPRKPYRSLRDKTFDNVLTTLFRTEFGFLGGPAVIKLMVDRILELAEEYYPKKERLRFGQLLWFAVDKGESKAQRRGMKSMRLRPVILSLVTPADISDYANGVTHKEIEKKAVIRLIRECYDQGGVLAAHDVAIILHRNREMISGFIREYQKSSQELLPTRGVIHDMGGAVTHKEIIVTEYLSGKESPQISRDIDHSIVASDRYIKHANQIRAALRHGVPQEEISRVTGINRRLVTVYTNLLLKLAKDRKDQEIGG